MPTPIIMPKFGMTQEEATVLGWLCKEGDLVEQGDPVLEVETDKVVMEVEAPASGILSGISAQEGDVVPVTGVIAYILQPGESLPKPETQSKLMGKAEPLDSKTARATPTARRVAKAAGVDIEQVASSGSNNRVTREDVEAYLAQSVSAPTAASIIDKPRATPAARRIAREHGLDLAPITGSGPRGRIQAADVQAAVEQHRTQPAPGPVAAEPLATKVVPLQGMRRTIATRMQQSYQTAPHIMLTVEVDMSAAQALRNELNAQAEAIAAPRISVTAVLVKVCAWALQRHPWVNASLHEETIHLHQTVNIGVAVALPEGKGLIVPVIRQAEQLGLAEIASQLQDLTRRARQGQLRPDDVRGGTFTITNLGIYGIDHFTAIINPPQSAILAVGRIAKQAMVIERETGDEVTVSPMMKMTLAADHRVLDGAIGAQFLQDVVKALEQPSLLLW